MIIVNEEGRGAMSELNCEYVRDVLPDVLAGRAPADVSAVVQAHLVSCDDCRAEAALLELLRTPATVPAGLHERVVSAASKTRTRTRFRRSDLAMAATLAAAVIGGSVLLETRNSPVVQATAPGVTHVQSLGAVGVEDAMLSGKASLDDLSVEQLEQLLGEIES